MNEDPFRKLRAAIQDGSVKVWCYCFSGPEPDRWVPPDDWHADVCCIDHIQQQEARNG